MATKPYTDQLLTGVCVESSKQGGFIADQILLPATARKQTGVIGRMDEAGDKLRVQEDVIAKGGEANLVDVDVDYDMTYHCKKYGFAKAVADEDKENAETEFAAHSDAATEIMERIDLAKESRMLAAIAASMVGATLTEGLTGNDLWSDYTNSDPLTYLEKKIALIEDRGAGTPTRLAMASRTARILMLHPDVRGVGGGVIRPEEEIGHLENMRARLKSVLGLEEVLIATSVVNSASAGVAKSVGSLWGRNVLLFANSKPSLAKTHSGLGMTVKWNTGSAGGAGGFMDGKRVVRWREDKRDADMVKVTEFYDQKITNTLAGFWITTAVAAP